MRNADRNRSLYSIAMCLNRRALSVALMCAVLLSVVVSAPGRVEAAEAKYIYDAAVLPNGHIAVLYISGGQVVLGDFDPSNDKWSKQDIVSGKDAALALDAGGNPHVAYITTDDDLGYTYFDGASWSDPEVIDSLNFNDVPGVLTYPDIAIDANGYAHIAYLDSKGGYTGGNDYSTYDKDDLMYATNASGSFTRLVRSYSHGWLWSPDGWRNLVNPPPKITWIGDDYCIGVEQYNYDKGMSTQYHNYSYSLLFTPSEPSNDLGFLIRSSTTNSDIFTLYEVDNYGAIVYSLYTKSGSLYVTADEDEIPEATKASTVQGADLFAAPTGALYYSSINTNLLLLYQNGEFKEDLTLPASISTTHKRMATVADAGNQYVLYTDTAGKAWICDVSTESGDLNLSSFEIPDKLPVTISGVSVENKTYDGAAVSYTGTPSSVITDGGDTAAIGEYTYTWWDVTAGAALASAPVDAGSYKLIVSVSESDGMYTGSVDVPFTISPKTISILGIEATDRAYDGTAIVAITGGSPEGLVEGDTVTPTVPATGTVASANVGLGKAVTLADLTLSGADAPNYTLTQPTGITVDITQAPLTLTAATASDKPYDGTTTATVTGATFSGLQNGETLAVGTDYTATAAFSDKDAGSDKPVAGTITLSDTTKANNYSLADGSFEATADITKAAGLAANEPSKTVPMFKEQVRAYSYDLSSIALNKTDAGTRTYSLGALTGGELFSSAPSIDADGFTLRFTSASLTEGTATQVVKITTDNYQDAAVTFTFNLVDKTAVTISGVEVESKTYDGTPASYTGTPVATVGTPIFINEYTYTWYDVTAGAVLASAPVDAGSYKLIVAVSEDDSTYQGSVDVPFTISPKTISISGIAATNKTYDGTTLVAITGCALDGLVADDAVTPIVAATGVVADANAGSGKAVTIADVTLAGPDASNYTVTQPTGITVDITHAPLTVTSATVATKVYDGTTAATVTAATFSGLQNGETLALGTDFTATAAFTDKNADYDKYVTGTITLSDTTKANNYSLASGWFGTTSDITKAAGLVATNPSDIQMIKAQVREYSFDLSTIGLNKADGGTTAYSLGALTGGGIFSPVPSIDDDGVTLRFTSGGMAVGSATQVINVSTQNYQDTTATLTFVLVDKTPVTVTGVSVECKTYDGTVVSHSGTPSATVTVGGTAVTIDEFTYTWYDVTAGAPLASAPKDAGPYKLIVAVSVDDSTYTGALDVPFNISKEDIIVKPGDYSIYTGGALPTPEIQYVGLVGGEIGSDVVTYSEPLEMEIRDSEGNPLVSSQISGTYTIVFTNTPVITSTNYDVVTATGTLTISSRPVSGGAPVNSVNIETSDDTTTAKTQATVLGGEASTLLSSADINAIIAEVRSEGSERVVLAPVISTEVKGASLRLPMSSVSSLAVMGLPVTVRSPHAEVTLSGEALAEIGGETGSNLVIETRRNEDSSITVRVRVDDRALDRVNGIKVTIPADSPSASSVLVKVSADGTEEIVKKSACDENGITAILEGSATVKVIRNAKTFQDVQPSHWANGVIAFASSRELFNGTGEGQFSPELAMTRGMFVTVLHRLEGAVSEGNVASFEDVPADAWYAGGVAWALENGITEGVGGGRFAPDESITREQLAVMMFKYAKAMGFDTSVEGDLAVFTDADQVADWAEEAMRYAVGAGLIGGKGQGVLDPKAGATRAEVAAILQRFVVNVVIGL